MRARRSVLAAFAVLACLSVVPDALAACSDEVAHSKAQELVALIKRKLQTKPDEARDLGDDFGDVMAETAGRVTEQTCMKLDELLRKARAL